MDRFVFRESLPHFTVDSFSNLQSICTLCVELLYLLFGEVATQIHSSWGKSFLWPFPSIHVLIPFPQNHATNKLIHTKVEMSDRFHRGLIFELSSLALKRSQLWPYKVSGDFAYQSSLLHEIFWYNRQMFDPFSVSPCRLIFIFLKY